MLLVWNGGKDKQECIPVGCILSAVVAISPATHVCPPPHMPHCHACPPPHTPPFLPCMPHTPPPRTTPAKKITDRCKNITFLELLLRTVKIKFSRSFSVSVSGVSPVSLALTRLPSEGAIEPGGSPHPAPLRDHTHHEPLQNNTRMIKNS